MACVLCEHCQTPVEPNEKRVTLKNYSYHEKCRKCYVCSETNLRNAEVFKGVIFCSSCSHRIFQGCSTAKRTKDTAKKTKDRSHKRRSYRTREMNRRPHGILAMAGQASSDTSKSRSIESKHSEPQITSEIVITDGKPTYNENKDLKKPSAEIGMTTDVTQQLLKELDCPVVHQRKDIKKLTRPALTLSSFKKFQKSGCSDLRVAELGTSREIANMALRHKSELPVIIVPEKKVMTSQSASQNMESESNDRSEEWPDSPYTSKNSTKSRWMDRRLGSLLKLPYYSFKKNILSKSSAISVMINSKNKVPLKEKLRRVIHQEIASHQKRGVKRLYSTLNRKRIPHRLGWAHLVANVHIKNNMSAPRCKHFKTSHSYRCMRAQAMKLAGPTRSELAVLRRKIKNAMSPVFIRKLGTNYKRYPALTISDGCGSSNAEHSRVKLKIT